MSEKAEVKKGQVYLCKDSKRRDGITRHITIERANVREKRFHDTKRELYAVGVSRIEAVEAREGYRSDLVGKKRRVFIRVDRLLSADYSLVPAKPEHDVARPASCEKHSDAPVTPSPVEQSLAEAGVESPIPGL